MSHLDGDTLIVTPRYPLTSLITLPLRLLFFVFRRSGDFVGRIEPNSLGSVIVGRYASSPYLPQVRELYFLIFYIGPLGFLAFCAGITGIDWIAGSEMEFKIFGPKGLDRIWPILAAGFLLFEFVLLRIHIYFDRPNREITKKFLEWVTLP